MSTSATTESPTISHEVAFWALLIQANVWIAVGPRWVAVPYMLMALKVRLPYWLRAWSRT
jgi:hypothetical protein